MTSVQILGLLWPFICFGLFYLFARVLMDRDTAALDRIRKAAQQVQAKQAAE
jgi:translation elongation factor EF-1beta